MAATTELMQTMQNQYMYYSTLLEKCIALINKFPDQHNVDILDQLIFVAVLKWKVW